MTPTYYTASQELSAHSLPSSPDRQEVKFSNWEKGESEETQHIPSSKSGRVHLKLVLAEGGDKV